MVLSKHYAGISSTGTWWIALRPDYVDFEATPFFSEASPTADIEVSDWVHIVFTYNKSLSLWTFYINNGLGSSWTLSFNIQNTSRNLYIGTEEYTSLQNFFNGTIDDIRIYNRALSESEIYELYNVGAGCGSGYTETDIDAAREEGRQECTDDPSSCGIIIGGMEGTHATFIPSTGTLSIPYVDVPDYFGGIITYSVDLTIIPEAEPLSFSLSGTAPVK